MFLTSLLAGISYYKAAVPEELIIESGAVTQSELDLLKAVYEHGLGEFRYVNRLTGGKVTFSAEVIDAPDLQPAELTKGALVAVGGGKDSCVSVEALRQDSCVSVEALEHAERQVTLVSVNRPRPIVDVMNASELPFLYVERRIDPLLFELNTQGAYNGHVPITAIVSMTVVSLAALHGYDAVVMSNERSASVGNTEWDGQLVNHQWSKSLDAERLLGDVVAGSISPGIEYFSLLRPLSELDIARRFAKLDRYHDVFTSCNRAFRIDETRRVGRWCRDCPKCRFVFLALAPFMNPTRLAGIFGGDMLRDKSQAEGFDALMGWNAFKPFECVGEVEESVAAFKLLTENRAWRDHELVRRFEEQILPEILLPDDLLSKPFELAADHRVPPSFMELLMRLGDNATG